MIKTPLLRYHQWGRGHVPILQARVVQGELSSINPIDFILDTGASFSHVQKLQVRRLLGGTSNLAEESTGAKDANGKWLMGIPLDVNVRLVDAPDFPEVPERIWVCSGIEFNMLGQTFLEKVAAHFMNFPENKRGRYFSLTLSPFRVYSPPK